MKIFISGGCKNGKSFYAERMAKYQSSIKQSPLYYIATMISKDEEDDRRIERHIKEREGLGFQTIEIYRCIKNILKQNIDKKGSFLLDSVTALLANEMFSIDGSINENAHIKITEEISIILNEIKDIVFVSDYIYSDAIDYEKYTDMYRKNLAYIDKNIARMADIVLEISFGNITWHKGNSLLKDIETLSIFN